MNKLIITLIIIFLLIAILCLKISLVEYFSIDDKKIQSLIDNLSTFGIGVNYEGVKKDCSVELEAVKNDSSVDKVLNSMFKGGSDNVSKLASLDIPSCVDRLYDCIIDNAHFENI